MTDNELYELINKKLLKADKYHAECSDFAVLSNMYLSIIGDILIELFRREVLLCIENAV